MANNDYLLTFEIVDGGELEIHGNAEGLRRLMASIARVVDTGRHDHLMTPSWGGDELSEGRQREGSVLVNAVTIRRWPESDLEAPARGDPAK